MDEGIEGLENRPGQDAKPIISREADGETIRQVIEADRLSASEIHFGVYSAFFACPIFFFTLFPLPEDHSNRLTKSFVCLESHPGINFDEKMMTINSKIDKPYPINVFGQMDIFP